MSVEGYGRWAQSPVRQLLKRVASGGRPPRPEELDRLGLPARQKKALVEAIGLLSGPVTERGERPQRLRDAERWSSEITDSLPDDWEWPQEKLEREASEGDPKAMKQLDDQKQYWEDMATRIREAKGHV